jgi:hypothetical protein
MSVGCGAKNPTPEKFAVTKPLEHQTRQSQPHKGAGQEPMEKDQEGGQDPHKVVVPVKEEEEGEV